MPLPSLPFDIHARIIQFVYILSQSRNIDYPTLSACALVCKDWTAPAQRLLFRRIRPSDTAAHASLWLNHAVPLLMCAVTSRSHLGTYVRSIAIHALPNIVELLRRCPYITLLHLVGNGPPWLKLLHTLRTLGLRPSVLVVPASADRDVVHTALAALPSVRHLVSLDDPEDPPAEPLISLSLPSAAQLLSVTSDDIMDFSQLCVQPATVPATEIRFEELDLYDLHFENMSSVEYGVARNLRALTTYEAPSGAVLNKLTALESLIIGDLPSWPISLPRTLLHFGFHAHYDNYAHEWEKAPREQPIAKFAAALSEPPNLRLVSVTSCSNYAVRDALRGASEARGVDFVEYADPSAYPNFSEHDTLTGCGRSLDQYFRAGIIP
ncbi:hypothetical protein FA95DRAFT_1578498 [Auriscalpium vulgare]|uniref:Uncharacterized protein n=1 Tax=Auriscalpium vulgare TaxID=40419 RepID=A0ACB8R2C1_9AGAM|nr:hypothetical protein FA95DRAFT_1578498 [Auriscalpium vulgare]